MHIHKYQAQHILCFQRLWKNRPHYSKPVDVFSLACVTRHVMSDLWPEPKDLLCGEHWRHNDCLHRNARWDKYITVCVQLALSLHNKPEHDQKFRCLYMKLNEIKVIVEKQVPFATDNKFELHIYLMYSSTSDNLEVICCQ